MNSLTAPPRPRLECLAFPGLLSGGDLDGAAFCFARDACLLTQDGTAVHDRHHIRPLLAQLIARRTRIEVQESNVLFAGEVAFVRERWAIDIFGVEGSRYAQTCESALVVRNIEDRWKLAIVAPWGLRSGPGL